MTDAQPKTDTKAWGGKNVVRKDVPFGLTAINQQPLAWFFESAIKDLPKNESLAPLFEGGTEKLKRRLCSLAATLTCVNNLRLNWTPDDKWGPWIGVKQIAQVLLNNQGIEISAANIIPEDKLKTEKWKNWQSVSQNGDLYFHANACVAEALGVCSLVVEGIPYEDFLIHLKRGGCACISVDNSFTGNTNLEPGGHIVSVLGIRYDEAGENALDGEAIIYDPYPYVVPGEEMLQSVPLTELQNFILKHPSHKVRGILFSTNIEELDRYKEFESLGAAKSQKVIDEIKVAISSLPPQDKLL